VPRYAATTDVSSDRSIAEIKKTLMRYGADQFAYMENLTGAAIAFVIHERQVRFMLPLPSRTDREFTHHSRGARTAAAAEAAYEQAVKQRWRALALVVKAKLEAVDAEIVTFEQEFAMHMVLPNGQSVFDVVIPAIDEAYAGSGEFLLQIEAGRG
jgi:hypothetical protein